jgi:nitroimidazol reductase NimA-like FMN-containing flavoprotein (pyridoxamine 5'-phosphate oxidase superfamily)
MAKAQVPKATRPWMPGYGVPRETHGLLPWKWAENLLRKSHNYWLATTRPEGAPHAMPIWGIWVESVFYFSTGRQSRKAKNLSKNPRCVICNERAERAVIVEGVAKEVTDPARIEELGKTYFKKYKPWKLDPAMGPIYAVTPLVVFGLDESKSMEAATKWVFPIAKGRATKKGKLR